MPWNQNRGPFLCHLLSSEVSEKHATQICAQDPPQKSPNGESRSIWVRFAPFLCHTQSLTMSTKILEGYFWDWKVQYACVQNVAFRSHLKFFFAKSNSTNSFTFASGQPVVTHCDKVANMIAMNILDHTHAHTCMWDHIINWFWPIWKKFGVARFGPGQGQKRKILFLWWLFGWC